jgi:hypothetical protein
VRVVPVSDPRTLRELAAAIEARDPSRQARAGLSPEALEELAAMVVAGRHPTIGWWRRHLHGGSS